jgi:hypothetical protein
MEKMWDKKEVLKQDITTHLQTVSSCSSVITYSNSFQVVLKKGFLNYIFGL